MNEQLMSIRIEGEQFVYTEIKLYRGRKQINQEIAKENLQLFYSIIEKTDIKYGLIYGTLLGAIRENNFIEHDEDIDIFILGEYEEDFQKLLKQFRNLGLELVRYNYDLLSLMRKGEYIDVYFFYPKRIFGFIKVRIHDNRNIILAKYLENPNRINFLGMNIPIPSEPEKLLKKTYGSNWRIPIKNQHEVPNALFFKLITNFPIIKKLPFYLKISKIYKKLFFRY